MIPKFTAEAALVPGRQPYAGEARPTGAPAVVAQQLRRGVMSAEGSGEELAPATCTCPCCLLVNGRLVCC